MITSLPFVFEPCADFQKEIEKSVLKRCGPDIRALWNQNLIYSQAHFLKKYESVLKEWKNAFPPEKSQRDEFRKALLGNLKLIKSPSERESFKKEAKRLFNTQRTFIYRPDKDKWNFLVKPEPKRLSSPHYVAAMVRDYKQIIGDAADMTVSAHDIWTVLEDGVRAGCLTESDRARFLKLMTVRTPSPKTRKRIGELYDKFPEEDQKKLVDVWVIQRNHLRRQEGRETYCDFLHKLLFDLHGKLIARWKENWPLPDPKEVEARLNPPTLPEVEDVFQRCLDNYLRLEDRNKHFVHYFNSTLAGMRRNFLGRYRFPEKACPHCGHIIPWQKRKGKLNFSSQWTEVAKSGLAKILQIAEQEYMELSASGRQSLKGKAMRGRIRRLKNKINRDRVWIPKSRQIECPKCGEKFPASLFYPSRYRIKKDPGRWRGAERVKSYEKNEEFEDKLNKDIDEAKDEKRKPKNFSIAQPIPKQKATISRADLRKLSDLDSNVLRIVKRKRKKAIKNKEISRRLNSPESSISRSLHRLMEKGFLE
jgi:hypothetical protein